jgi:hypothetical protein
VWSQLELLLVVASQPLDFGALGVVLIVAVDDQARPAVGLAATPKSSNRSRLPVQETPLSQTPPKWFVADAV